ncbi:hypothetical protein PTSG_07935 [Salpingoeca rosetta]|uniref:Uncharacterized protein n=1 Tax=Salpingoeca rosetta (strain ATCC 50818 / BSB-021) TaxID=946362 RepID=F2UGR7_SALR5|nr:uncharacterized protein PTSG_07935 [Salpingoeca rosetta]EGD75817.1 hypothetical protein PTSG_07935 [Salpingoeca rosetta]|eukprot:XP_004991738.1 hypothetical protein PTSG_07935 [Salpingoeca rosetta]
MTNRLQQHDRAAAATTITTSFVLDEQDAQDKSTHVVFHGDFGLQDLAQEMNLDLPSVYRHMSSWASIHMARKNGQQYECFMPTSDQARAMEQDVGQSFHATLADVQVEMTSACVTEVCPEERIEQYHTDASGRIIDDKTDDIPAVILLGFGSRVFHKHYGPDTAASSSDNNGDDGGGHSGDAHTKPYRREKKRVVDGVDGDDDDDNGNSDSASKAPPPLQSPRVSISRLPEHVTSGRAKALANDPLTQGRFIVETFEGGHPCPKTGMPRRSDVLYVCDGWWLARLDALSKTVPAHSAPHPRITHVEESPTCNYLVVVHVPSFCSARRRRQQQQSLLCTWCFDANDVHLPAIRSGLIPEGTGDHGGGRDDDGGDGGHHSNFGGDAFGLHRHTSSAVDIAVDEEVVCAQACVDPWQRVVLSDACKHCLEDVRTRILGNFLGLYTCRGEQVIRLSLTYARFDATTFLFVVGGDAHFFYDRTYGSYEYIGVLDPRDRKFLLSSGRWHVRPRDFYPAPLRGAFTADWSTMTGSVPACMDGPFHFRRVVLPPADLYTSSTPAVWSSKWAGRVSSLISRHAPHTSPTAALLHVLPPEALWFTPVHVTRKPAAVIRGVCKAQSFDQLLQGVLVRQTIFTTIDGRRATCFRGICLQLCARLTRPYTLGCLAEIWALTGLPLNAVMSPLRAPERQLLWWQGQRLHHIMMDMRVHRHFSHRTPYTTYCSTIRALSPEHAIRDMSRFVPSTYRDKLAAWIYRAKDAPKTLRTDVRQVELEGAVYVYLHHASERIGSSIDAFQRTSWEESAVLAGIHRFRESHDGL